MFKKYQLRSYNYRLIIILILISGYGLSIVNSADSDYTVKQLFGILLSFALMAFISFIDYNWILKFYWVLYGVVVLLLLSVKLFGSSAGGAQRWIAIGGTRFQPSEIAKLFLVLFCVKLISTYKNQINSWKFLLLLFVLLAFPLFLIVTQPDLSTTLLIVLILLTVIFCAGLSYRIIGITLLVVVPIMAGLLIYIQNPNQKLLKEYQRERIMAFIDPEKYDSKAYQQKYAEMAVGSGQLTGKGLNNDDPTSLKNSDYILEPHTDFIFAVIGEELGFVGSVITVLLLGAIIFECLLAAHKARDYTGKLICCGIAANFAFQTFINIGVVTKILPNTGLPLPFISSGLSSVMSCFMAMGIVLNISLQRKTDKDDDIFTDDFKGIKLK